MTRPVELFVVSTGVSGNLGDAVIRRRVLAWVEGLGTRHVYVGRTTEGWLEQLQLDPADVLYRAADRRRWLLKLMFGRGRRALVYDPGEVPLGRAHLKSEIVFFLMGVWLRLRGSVVVRPPRAVAHYERATGTFHRLACRTSNVVLWRDRPTVDRMRCGKLVPDTAFSEPAGPRSDLDRNLLVISLRGPRPVPTEAWFEAVATFAAKESLQITVVSQVDEDVERSAEVAGRLAAAGATLLPWGDGSDLDREIELRATYARTAIVISDRLHVLLLAAQAGATPIEAVISPAPKVGTHFATAGIENITLDVAELDAPTIVAWLDRRAVGRSDEISASVDAARAKLDDEVRIIRALIGRGRVSEPV